MYCSWKRLGCLPEPFDAFHQQYVESWFRNSFFWRARVWPQVFGSGPVGPHSVLDKCVPGYYLRRSDSVELGSGWVGKGWHQGCFQG